MSFLRVADPSPAHLRFHRIMTTGFLDGHQANGAFVAVGPPGFTALALINLGDHARKMYVCAPSVSRVPTDSLHFSLPLHGLVSPQAGEIWYAVSVMSGVMLFGLAVFLFIFGVLPYWFKVHKHLSEILGCMCLPRVLVCTFQLITASFFRLGSDIPQCRIHRDHSSSCRHF